MLKGSTRRYLRGLAHELRPVVQTGKEGLSEAVLAAIDTALDAHELIKVKIAAERDERRETVEAIAERLACEPIGSIGRMAIFYRQHEDPERRKIVLPE